MVYLEVEPSIIYERLSNNVSEINKRPLLQGDNPLEKISTLYNDRKDKYEQADIHVKIPSNYDNEEVTNLVINSMLQFIQDNPPRWQTWKNQKNQKALDMAAMVSPKYTDKKIILNC